MHYFEGQARVFTSMEEASWAVSNDKIQKGDVLVIRYEGPKGGPGMREMHMTCSLIVGRGMDEDCALVTDGRFSGSHPGALYRPRVPGGCRRRPHRRSGRG